MNSKPRITPEFMLKLLRSFYPEGFNGHNLSLGKESEFLLNQYVIRNPDSCAYLLDYTKNSYSWFSENVENILGWNKIDFIEKGPTLAYENFNPEQLKMIHIFWNRAIFHVYEQRKNNPKNRILAIIQYQFRTKKGDFLWIRQENSIIDFLEEQIAFDFGTISEIREKPDQKPGFEIVLLTSRGTQLLESGFAEIAVNLSKREMEILRLASEGLNANKVAEKLNISVHTVYQHRKNIMEKLQVNNMPAAIAKAFPSGTLG